MHTFRNPGDEPLVLLVSALIAADEPFLQPVDMDMDMMMAMAMKIATKIFISSRTMVGRR